MAWLAKGITGQIWLSDKKPHRAIGNHGYWGYSGSYFEEITEFTAKAILRDKPIPSWEDEPVEIK